MLTDRHRPTYEYYVHMTWKLTTRSLQSLWHVCFSVCLYIKENTCVLWASRHNPHFSFDIADQKKRKTKKNEEKKCDTGKLKKREVREEFIKEVTANAQNTQLADVEEINDIWNRFKKGIDEAAG